MKTVLAPNAPWPKQNDKTPRKKTKPSKPRPVLALPCDMLDYFAETRAEIASGKAKRNPKYDYRKIKKL